MSQRVVRFPESATDKGMDRPETIDYYSKTLSFGRLMFKRIAKRALRLKPDAEVIADIGTGPGFVAIELAKLTGKKVKAVDLSPNMLKKAVENAKKDGVEIEPVESFAESLPFADHSVDLLTSSSLIHMLNDLSPFIKEIKRVMKPGGRVLITAFKRDTLWIIKEFALLHSFFIKKKPLEGMQNVLEASFTRKEIKELLEKEGISNYRIFTGIWRLEFVIGF